MFLNGIILISAKQQNSLLGICFAIMFFLWAFTQFTENHEFIHGYLAHYRRMLLGLAGFFLVFSLVFYKLIPEKYVHINQYHAMTRGVLMTSDNPEDTLKEFNSSIQFSLLNKSEYYEKYPPIDVESPTLISDFYPNTGFFQIGFYYLRHLDQLYKMLDIGTHQAYFLQPEVIGSYEESAGYPPGTITNVFTLHSRIFKNATPRSFGFLLVWMIAILLANFKNKSKLTVLFTIMIVGLSQIVISVLGAGDADLTKHLFLYNSAFDLVNFIVVCSILQGFASYITQKIHIKTPATKRYEYKQE